MQIRDATVDDAAALATLADDDLDAVRLVRDRSVRVAEREGDVAGFVAFDAWRGTVHVTRVDGDPDAVGRLLDEPCAFAEREGLPVEVVLVEGDGLADVLDDVGFEEVGPGPMFDGDRTRRYRCEPAAD
ncbi:hypothetical protein [Halobacterium yunchengense]|uniref:hypothetical protein n=1 Tax=Halobacterium yunchengense TaxID=3108497 RepID=UPI00300B00A7